MSIVIEMKLFERISNIKSNKTKQIKTNQNKIKAIAGFWAERKEC